MANEPTTTSAVGVPATSAEPEPAAGTKGRKVAKGRPLTPPEPSDAILSLPDGRTMAEDDFMARMDQLAAPFPPERVEKLPKQLSKGDRDRYQCREGTPASADGHYCGGFHARAIHLDYVGHAGVTDRLNAVDPFWSWEPMALTQLGTPLFTDGGMWIRLTVLGITRLGFGDAAGKSGPNAIKEAIGDAIRNAAMRFGVATYLWSKSDAAKAIAAGGDPDADQDEPSDHLSRAASATREQGRAPEPSEASKRVWAAYNVLSEREKVDAQRSWPAHLPGPDYITTPENERIAIEHIAAIHRKAEQQQPPEPQQDDGSDPFA